MSLALLWLGIILNLLSLIPGAQFLSTLALAALIYSLFRILSRNNVRRYQENAWYMKHFGPLPAKAKQAFVRLKNSRKYVYFDCPQCHSKLRLPRGVGNVKITCGKCGTVIDKKA